MHVHNLAGLSGIQLRYLVKSALFVALPCVYGSCRALCTMFSRAQTLYPSSYLASLIASEAQQARYASYLSLDTRKCMEPAETSANALKKK
jgi:hypothetical protein